MRNLQCSVRDQPYQVNQECINHGTDEVNIFTEIVETVQNLNNRSAK